MNQRAEAQGGGTQLLHGGGKLFHGRARLVLHFLEFLDAVAQQMKVRDIDPKVSQTHGDEITELQGGQALELPFVPLRLLRLHGDLRWTLHLPGAIGRGPAFLVRSCHAGSKHEVRLPANGGAESFRA